MSVNANAGGPLRFKHVKITSLSDSANLEVEVAGNGAEYTYSGVPGTTWIITDEQTVTFFGIPTSSEFVLSVKDNYGSYIEANVSIPFTKSGEVAFYYTHPSCCALSNGSITMSQIGGDDVMYAVNDLQEIACNYQPSCGYTDLDAGEYRAEVSFGSDNFIVTTELVYSRTISCIVEPIAATYGKENGKIALADIEGGSGAPYKVKLKGPVSRCIEFPAKGGFMDLPAGVYSLKVTSDNGCTAIERNIVIRNECD